MSGYPAPLRSMLKALPSILMAFSLSTVMYLYLNGILRKSQDHLPKYQYRSTRFERALRYRDENNRRIFEPLLTRDPNLI